MKLLIDIPEHQYNNIVELSSVSIGRAPYKGIIMYAINAIKQGSPVPDNATDGDAIMAMFPNAKIKHGVYGINGTPLICLSMGTRYDVHEMSFVEDFWNAPYKGGE